MEQSATYSSLTLQNSGHGPAYYTITVPLSFCRILVMVQPILQLNLTPVNLDGKVSSCNFVRSRSPHPDPCSDSFANC